MFSNALRDSPSFFRISAAALISMGYLEVMRIVAASRKLISSPMICTSAVSISAPLRLIRAASTACSIASSLSLLVYLSNISGDGERGLMREKIVRFHVVSHNSHL